MYLCALLHSHSARLSYLTWNTGKFHPETYSEPLNLQALTDAELDITLHEQDHEDFSTKVLSKLRQQRPPVWHSDRTGVSNLDTAREGNVAWESESVPNSDVGTI